MGFEIPVVDGEEATAPQRPGSLGEPFVQLHANLEAGHPRNDGAAQGVPQFLGLEGCPLQSKRQLVLDGDSKARKGLQICPGASKIRINKF
jgi:hypothetical protein